MEEETQTVLMESLSSAKGRHQLEWTVNMADETKSLRSRVQ